MSRKEKENHLYEKDKVIRIVKSLIIHRNSVLSVKYFQSHDKVVIFYKEDAIELHKDTKSITYLDIIIPLSKREYKELYRLFMDEVKKRYEAKTLEKFDKLARSLDDESEQQPDDKPEQSLVDDSEHLLDDEHEHSLDA